MASPAPRSSATGLQSQGTEGMATRGTPTSAGVPVGTVLPSMQYTNPMKTSKVLPKLRHQQLKIENSNVKGSPVGSTGTSSPQPTSRAHNRHFASYPTDCGTKKLKHLSLAKVEAEMNKRHPRRRIRTDTGHSYVKHATCGSRTGRHLACGGSSLSDFSKYGLGIDLYFKFMKAMGVLLFFLTLCALPVLIFYHAGDALEDEAGSTTSGLALLSLGNFGQGTPLCASGYSGSVVTLDCPAGTVMGQVEGYFGDVSGDCQCPAVQAPDPTCSGEKMGDVCSPNGTYCFKSSDRPIFLPSGRTVSSGTPCCASRQLYGRPDFSDLNFVVNATCNSGTAQGIVNGRCTGTQSCNIAVDTTFVAKWMPNTVLGTDCIESKKVAGVCQDTFNSDHSLDTCTSTRPMRLVVSAMCYQLDLQVFGKAFAKRDLALYICYIDILAMLVFLGVTYWIRIKESDEKVSRKSVTAANYTVMVTNLPKGMTQYDLEEALRTHFEGLLSRAPPITKELNRIRVADINFGVNNSQLIEMLKSRGKKVKELDIALKKKQFAVAQSAHDLTASLQTDEEKIAPKRIEQRIIRLEERIEGIDREINAYLEGNLQFYAVVAFVTFEEEEGALRALEQYPDSVMYRVFQSKAKRFEGHKIRVRPAPEPSDVLWENLESGSFERFLRSFFTLLCTLIFLGASAVLVYLATDKKRELQAQTETVNCNTITDISNKTLVIEDQLWQYFNSSYGMTGRLNCYCKHRLFSSDPTAVFRETFFNPETEQSEFWCKEWLSQYIQFQALVYTTTAVVIGVNLFFRLLLGPVVRFEHNWSKTGEILSRATKQFFLQFTNTALLMLILQAQFNVQWSVLQEGQFTDFTVSWYLNVGVSIVITMIAFIFSPHIGPIMMVAKRALIRLWDRSCTWDRTRTRKVTQQQLENMYLGPELFLDERYAQMLAALFFSLTYSTGLPVLIPLAGLFFFTLYWVDKWLFCNLYRSPPQYSWHLAKRASVLLPLVAVFHFSFGAWMLSNQDIIPPNDLLQQSAFGLSSNAGGKITTILQWLDTTDPTRVGIATRMKSSHVFPMFVAFGVVVVFLILSRLFWSQFMWLWNLIRPRTKLTTSGAPNYFDALPNDVLESGLYDGSVKSMLIMPYMEAVQRRMLKKGWTKQQLMAIQRSFDTSLKRESVLNKHPEILQTRAKSTEELGMMADIAVINAKLSPRAVQHKKALGGIQENNLDTSSDSSSGSSDSGSSSGCDSDSDGSVDSRSGVETKPVIASNSNTSTETTISGAGTVDPVEIKLDEREAKPASPAPLKRRPQNRMASAPLPELASDTHDLKASPYSSPTTSVNRTITSHTRSGLSSTTAEPSLTAMRRAIAAAADASAPTSADSSPSKRMPRPYHSEVGTTRRPSTTSTPINNEDAVANQKRRQLFRETMNSSRGEIQTTVMQGLHSYDLHNNYEYRRAFALDALVPERFLRGLPGYEAAPDLPENALEATLNMTIAACASPKGKDTHKYAPVRRHLAHQPPRASPLAK